MCLLDLAHDAAYSLSTDEDRATMLAFPFWKIIALFDDGMRKAE